LQEVQVSDRLGGDPSRIQPFWQNPKARKRAARPHLRRARLNRQNPKPKPRLKATASNTRARNHYHRHGYVPGGAPLASAPVRPERPLNSLVRALDLVVAPPPLTLTGSEQKRPGIRPRKTTACLALPGVHRRGKRMRNAVPESGTKQTAIPSKAVGPTT
jgi:hypothetical protein